MKKGSTFTSCGFSCNNLSKLFHSEDWASDTSWIASREGSTGETFDALIDWLLKDKPLVVQIENVPELLNEKHWPAAKQAFKEAGYCIHARELDSKRYGVLGFSL